MKFRMPQNALALAIGGLALAVAATGTAVAATGQVVNIADGTNAANLAKVDPSGSLRTAVYGGLISSKPTPPVAFAGRGSVPNFYTSGAGYVVVAGPSTATVALTRLSYTNSVLNAHTWELYLYRSFGNSASECLNNLTYNAFDTINIPARETVISPFVDAPVILKPPTGSQWCLVAGAGPTQDTSGGDDSSVYVSYAGYTVSGTFNPSAPAHANRPTGPSSGKPRLDQR